VRWKQNRTYLPVSGIAAHLYLLEQLYRHIKSYIYEIVILDKQPKHTLFSPINIAPKGKIR
jgi:hypothetical protein